MEDGILSDKTPIRVFVTHLFEKHPDYLRVIEYLESRDNFLYLATSDPDRIPPGGKEDLKEELRKQIRAAEIMVLPVSIYEANPDLVTFQMDVAGAFSKPIVAVKSFGETVMMKKLIIDRSADVVEWNERVLVDAIRHHARHEDTARWDVVEFKLDD
jgi:hypothetical protein